MKGRASGGVLLIVAGVWVLSQVLVGQALQRLGVVSSGGLGSEPDTIPVPNTPWRQKGGSTDAHGNPL